MPTSLGYPPPKPEAGGNYDWNNYKSINVGIITLRNSSDLVGGSKLLTVSETTTADPPAVAVQYTETPIHTRIIH